MKWDNLRRCLEEFGRRYQEAYKDKIQAGGHIASGDLYNSVKYNVVKNGDEFILDLNLKDYWIYLEEGTKPHFPPLEAIERWIDVKRIAPHAGKNGKVPTKKQLAYMIARKISIEGTKAGHYFKDTDVNLFSQLEDAIIKAIIADINDAMDEMLAPIR